MGYITDINQLDLNKLYTYSDYLTWRFNERVELILGKIFKMSPAPQSQHQYISSALIVEIGSFLKRKPCKVFPAPFDVRLPIANKKGELNTVVQPDVCVICDSGKIDKKGCNGAPDLVVEIISENTVNRDLHEKYELYEKSGVKEYWIVHPNDKTLSIFLLDNEGKYVPSKPLTYGDIAESGVLPGLELDLNEVFQDLVKEAEEEYLAKGTQSIG
jgi:Uma2 family endonuclease